MPLINLLKVGVLWLVDMLNRLYDPFEEFSRPIDLLDYDTLHERAERFEADFQECTIRDGTIYIYRQPLDLGDQALWHGVATAMWSLKGDQERVRKCLIGLADQQPGGILCRGIDEQGNRQWDASNDQATGHLLGLYMAWKYGNTDNRYMARILMADWADNILSRNNALVNLDGKPSQYGKLINGWKTDPLRLTLCLAIYWTAYIMTGVKQYFTLHDDFYNKYRLLIPYAKVSLWSWDTTYDTHRAAIHYSILNDKWYATKEVDNGIRRLSRLTHKQGNIWVDCLLRKGVKSTVMKVLNEISPNQSLFDHEVVNSTDSSIPKVMWGGEWCSKQPLPLWKKAADDFCWQRNRYSMDKHGPAQSRYTGLGYLAAYWLARKQGIITAED